MGHRLSSIYTKTGDDGSTGLANGERIGKATCRISTIGDVDELNSLVGLLLAFEPPKQVADCLWAIQQRLFDIGGELALPDNQLIQKEAVTKLEALIDSYNETLAPLKEFILPGGAVTASVCHLARTVCRRCERGLVKLATTDTVNPHTLAYINRLSDLLFVLARVLNKAAGQTDQFWQSQRLKSQRP